jgi:predicted component of viral defense system (DUF524 family)
VKIKRIIGFRYETWIMSRIIERFKEIFGSNIGTHIEDPTKRRLEQHKSITSVQIIDNNKDKAEDYNLNYPRYCVASFNINTNSDSNIDMNRIENSVQPILDAYMAEYPTEYLDPKCYESRQDNFDYVLFVSYKQTEDF